MPAWLAPTLKAVLPHLGTIVTAVAPAFTRKPAGAPTSQAQLLQEQIVELQTAVSQNAAHIKDLALQLQNTVTALEQAAALAETRLRRAHRLSLTAAAAAAIAVLVVLVSAFAP